MNVKKVELEIVCGVTSVIPDTPYIEIAFAGRSNVGKSSLINALMNRKAMAHISSKPGKTQTINYYNINDRMYLVDLPGYGYATANVEVKAQWGKMIEHYLKVSKQLAAVFLLIDIRHDPTDNDKLMYSWIKSQGYKPIIIATKLDKLNKSQVKPHIEAVRNGLEPDGKLDVYPFSAITKDGREEIWKVIDEIIGYNDEDETSKGTASGSGAVSAEHKSGAAGFDEVKIAGDASSVRKPRWKSTGKTVAKKTQKMRDKRHHRK